VLLLSSRTSNLGPNVRRFKVSCFSKPRLVARFLQSDATTSSMHISLPRYLQGSQRPCLDVTDSILQTLERVHGARKIGSGRTQYSRWPRNVLILPTCASLRARRGLKGEVSERWNIHGGMAGDRWLMSTSRELKGHPMQECSNIRPLSI
jgi:hypothetical protein